MCYLKFDKAQMTNLQDSLYKEFLITNRSGAYCNTTLVGCNIRKYHGLMVVPVPELDDENHVLLSSLDETIIQHGAEFNLGLHKYQGENYSPKGQVYRELSMGQGADLDLSYRWRAAQKGNGILHRRLSVLYPLHVARCSFGHHAAPETILGLQKCAPVDT